MALGRSAIAASLAALTLLSSCSDGASRSGPTVEVVGAFYPLAWAAQQVGGPRVHVLDLTPPGVEAHDTSLSARQAAAVERADVVLILGYLGFQPQVEAAAHRTRALVVEASTGLRLLPSGEQGLSADPHIWLDPVLMEHVARTTTDALITANPHSRSFFERRGRRLLRRLGALDASYRNGLRRCRFRTFVTTHEAFGYLAGEYGLRQIGIEGLTPAAEPRANQLRAAESAIAERRAAPAVFYEETAEGQRIGKRVAASVGASPLPLGTLEFDPAPRNYLAVLRENLLNLEKGLRCP